MQVAPLPRRKAAKPDFADANPFQSHDFQADCLAHPANLPFAAFMKDDAELVFILPADAGRQKRFAVQLESVLQ